MRRSLASLALAGALGAAFTPAAEAYSDDDSMPPRKVYCFAFAMAEGDKLIRLMTKRTLFVSPVFESAEDDVSLEVTYRRSIPDAGLATCVSEEYEPDIDDAWEQFVTLGRDDGTPVEIAPFPAGPGDEW
jgi:hypothetical protein